MLLLTSCIQMGFLGLAYSATVQKATKSMSKLVTLMLIPPLTMLILGAVAGAAADSLTANPPVFLGSANTLYEHTLY
jgi:hypothetical protein